MGYIVETKDIEKTSANKWCVNCNKHIKIGKSSIAVEYFDGEFNEVNVCSVSCMEEFEKEINNTTIIDDSDDDFFFDDGWLNEIEDY